MIAVENWLDRRPFWQLWLLYWAIFMVCGLGGDYTASWLLDWHDLQPHHLLGPAVGGLVAGLGGSLGSVWQRRRRQS